MPKTKKTEKRTVTCGKCKETGHNARTCPTPATAAAPKTEVPTPPVPQKEVLTKDEERRMSTVPKRDAPTASNSGSTAAPYRCPKCNQVAIIVIGRVLDHNATFKTGEDVFKGETRCEQCMNKPTPAELILKWGARPNEVVPIPGQDDA